MTATQEATTLTANDRCDKCGAQAYVRVRGMSGQLDFCAHDYEEIMNNPSGYEAMMSFMLEVLDERDRIGGGS